MFSVREGNKMVSLSPSLWREPLRALEWFLFCMNLVRGHTDASQCVKNSPHEAASFNISNLPHPQAVLAWTTLVTHESRCPAAWRELALSWVTMPQSWTVTMEMWSFCLALLSAA